MRQVNIKSLYKEHYLFSIKSLVRGEIFKKVHITRQNQNKRPVGILE